MSLRLTTVKPGLELEQLIEADASDVHRLIQHNRAHLTALGDYAEIVAMSRDDVLEELRGCPRTNLQLGIFQDDLLIGRVDINSPKTGVYVLGYWVDSNHTKRGFATAACAATIYYAQRELGAREVWAGVKETNVASVAVLTRLGFDLVETLPTHLRFRALLRGSPGDA